MDSRSESCSWSLFSGVGEGATRADRAASQLWRPLLILVSELYSCDRFWTYADDIARADDSRAEADRLARRYLPRRGDHGERGLILELLLVASESVLDRHDQAGRPGLALRRLVEVGGPVAYFVDDPMSEGRLSDLPAPSESRRIGTSGRAASASQIASYERGAELVRRRGAGICLAAGCDVEVGGKRKSKWSGPRRTTVRVDYCNQHQADSSDLDAMRRLLAAAAYAYRCRVFRSPSVARLIGSGAANDERIVRLLCSAYRVPGVVSQIRSGDVRGELAEAVSLSIERGLFAEAA